MLSSSFVGSTRLSSIAARAGGARVAVVAPPVVAPRIGLVVEAAHKKGSGHSKNGRDSVSKVRSWSAVCVAQGNKARNDGDDESKSSGHGGGKQKKKAAAASSSAIFSPETHPLPLLSKLSNTTQRRGIKVYGGQPVKAGGIIVRQLGTKVNRNRDNVNDETKGQRRKIGDEKLDNRDARIHRPECSFLLSLRLDACGPVWLMSISRKGAEKGYHESAFDSYYPLDARRWSVFFFSSFDLFFLTFFLSSLLHLRPPPNQSNQTTTTSSTPAPTSAAAPTTPSSR